MLNTVQCERGKKFSIYFVASLEYFPKYYLRQKTNTGFLAESTLTT